MCQRAPDFKWPFHCALLTRDLGNGRYNGLEGEDAVGNENVPMSAIKKKKMLLAKCM